MFRNKKKAYFQGMLEDAEKVIYDLEFKKFTALGERELTRRQYDQAQGALANINMRLKADLSKEEREHVETEQKSVESTIKELKAQLDAIDGTIVGSNPTDKLPEGAVGIDNNLRTWVQRREYIKSFIQSNC